MHRAAKSLIERTLHTFGYTMVSNRQVDRYPQIQFLARFLSSLSIDCVFDVGGNAGQYGRFLRREVGYTGAIVSFEPVPASLDRLRKTAAGDSNWLIEPYALGATPGKSVINVMAMTVFSSFLKPDHSRLTRFESGNRVVDELEVDVATLDDVCGPLLARLSCSAPYLKLDTQGFDLQVAAGAGRVIRQFRGLQTEASVTPIYEGMPDYAESLKAFSRLGFDISGIFSINPREHFPRMIEFDCHMINRAYAPAQDGIVTG